MADTGEGIGDSQANGAEERLRRLGYELGEPAPPLGKYVRCTVAGDLAFTSGHGPFTSDGRTSVRGQVGGEVSAAAGREAAALAVVACLASLRAELGSLERVDRIVKLLGFVNCAEGFDSTSSIIDGASELLVEVFGDRGVHSRSAIGTTVLPNGIPVEIELIARIRE